MRGYGYDVPPAAADVREAEPVPSMSVAGPHHRVQSINVEYFQERIFGEHFDRRVVSRCESVRQFSVFFFFFFLERKSIRE